MTLLNGIVQDGRYCAREAGMVDEAPRAFDLTRVGSAQDPATGRVHLADYEGYSIVVDGDADVAGQWVFEAQILRATVSGEIDGGRLLRGDGSYLSLVSSSINPARPYVPPDLGLQEYDGWSAGIVGVPYQGVVFDARVEHLIATGQPVTPSEVITGVVMNGMFVEIRRDGTTAPWRLSRAPASRSRDSEELDVTRWERHELALTADRGRTRLQDVRVLSISARRIFGGRVRAGRLECDDAVSHCSPARLTTLPLGRSDDPQDAEIDLAIYNPDAAGERIWFLTVSGQPVGRWIYAATIESLQIGSG